VPYIKYPNLKIFVFTYRAVVLVCRELNRTEQTTIKKKISTFHIMQSYSVYWCKYL